MPEARKYEQLFKDIKAAFNKRYVRRTAASAATRSAFMPWR